MPEPQQKQGKGQPRTMHHEVLHGVVLVVHDQLSPASGEWQAFIDAIGEVGRQTGKVKVLVYTTGAAPSAVQRKEVSLRAERYPLRIAVCTDSRLARGAIQALSWVVGLDIKGFELEAQSAACEYLDVAASHGAAFSRRARELHAELTQPSGTFRR